MKKKGIYYFFLLSFYFVTSFALSFVEDSEINIRPHLYTDMIKNHKIQNRYSLDLDILPYMGVFPMGFSFGYFENNKFEYSFLMYNYGISSHRLQDSPYFFASIGRDFSEDYFVRFIIWWKDIGFLNNIIFSYTYYDSNIPKHSFGISYSIPIYRIHHNPR